MNKRRKDTEGFWKYFFRRYDVIYTQHRGKDVEHRISTSRFIISLYVCALILVVAALTVLLLFYSPLKRLMPGYVSPEVRQQIVETSMRIDSLHEAVQRHQLYVMNIQDILRGEVKVDSINTIDSLTVLRSEDLMERTERENEFVRRYEETEKYNLTSQTLRKSEMEGLHFYPPVRGLLADPFNPADLHFGVDVLVTNDKNVNAVLDGTVVMSGYTANNGYVVVMQHTGNLVSVYKHLASTLVREGEKVKAGEVLGIAGVQGDKALQPYLHIELWHKGTALDPTQYISF
ncbi:MAG: M23 family metallopeptidase [Bacteroidaceae bacterium]|nr:M23 family metallopeptidase [Bacteroidaceae bacterium]MBQ3237682.1 M23 family metallopeptidase [Bacteroidaceae bacterium]MBQ7967898.1 M23 family metallopeptidase [Bacteroidaceae bacterium]MBR3985298.1 M23 family metallopeptidase [Bacteroidaceae bacterium]MBR4042295.1 M23 family metallopeptidase [Bacteroidaceae bacterium]